MDCKKFKENLYRFMDDELSDERLSLEMRRHLEACPICSLEFENEARLDKLLKSHLIQEQAPFELREAVIERIEKRNGWKKIFDLSRFRLIPSLSAVAAVIVIISFVAVSTFSRPFPVFAESINRHIDYMQGGYPIEIRSSDIDEVLAWFKGKLDFAVTRPHLDHSKVKLLGARICHLKGNKVAYFIYEKDGRQISAFVMDYHQLRLPAARSKVYNGSENTVYVKGEKGYESVFCYHKKIKTGCIIVSDIPQKELMGLMG